MQTHHRNTFTTIHTEGALLPVDLLQRISENDPKLDGLIPESYHLAPGEKLNEAIQRGEELLEAHQRVRHASKIRNIRYRVEPQLPPDVLGIYIFLPAI